MISSAETFARRKIPGTQIGTLRLGAQLTEGFCLFRGESELLTGLLIDNLDRPPLSGGRLNLGKFPNK
jgi:hypothetical protein